MRKSAALVGLVLALGLFAFTGCTAKFSNGEGIADLGPAAEDVHDKNSSEQGDNFYEETSSRGETPQGEGEGVASGKTPMASPLALLDTVDVSSAFGEETDGWSFVIDASGDLNASYGLSLTSEVSGKEKLNIAFGAGLGLEDLFGLRSDLDNALGFGLYGGGSANLFLQYRGPHADSEPVRKDFSVGFRHDGDLIWYAGEGESEREISLSGLKERAEALAMTKTFDRMKAAFAVIPEELGKGVSLRLAVEKLIALGFTAEIDDTEGVSISLKANAGFYTDLINDLLEEFLPAEWLDYLPRLDFGYERTLFNIKLAFDERGIFREYSMSSDVSLTASLEVRNLFICESNIMAEGGLSFTAHHGGLPASPDM